MKTKVLIAIASTILLTPVALSEIFKLWPIDVKVSLDLVKLLEVPRYFQWEGGGLDAHGMMTGDDTGGDV